MVRQGGAPGERGGGVGSQCVGARKRAKNHRDEWEMDQTDAVVCAPYTAQPASEEVHLQMKGHVVFVPLERVACPQLPHAPIVHHHTALPLWDRATALNETDNSGQVYERDIDGPEKKSEEEARALAWEGQGTGDLRDALGERQGPSWSREVTAHCMGLSGTFVSEGRGWPGEQHRTP